MIPISSSWVQSIVRALLQPETEELLDLAAVSPVVVLEAERPEWGNLKNLFHYGGSLSQGATPAELSAVGLRTPANVDQVVVVYFVHNLSVNPGDLIMGNLGQVSVLAGELAATPVTAPLDSGNISIPPGGATSLSGPVFNVRASSAGGVGAGVFNLHESLAAGERISKESHGWFVVLRPNAFVALQTQALNLAISANWWMYVRPTQRGRKFI